MSDYPECRKFGAISGEFGMIAGFMEWAEDNGYHFTRTQTFTETGTKLHNGETYEYKEHAHVPASVQDALYKFFEIDYEKLDAERQEILAATAAHNEKHRETYTVHPAPEEPS